MEKKSMLKAIKEAIALLLTLCLVTPALAGSFAPDVADDDPHILAIRTMEAEGIMGKNADGTYDPTGTVARGELASMLCKLLDGNKALTAGDSGFYDVPADHTANAVVRELAGKGIALGYGDGRYGPEDAVTYEQLTAMLARSLVGETRIQERGAYPFGHINVGQDFGLQTNVSGQVGVALDRANVAQMLYNYYDAVDPSADGMPHTILNWTGWDEATLRSYLINKLTYKLVNEGYGIAAHGDGWKNINAMNLDDVELHLADDGSLFMRAPVNHFISGFDDALEVPLDLYVGQQPSRSEAEIKQWLCQGTESDPWYGADVSDTGAGQIEPIYYAAQFNTDGTCSMNEGVLWSDLMNSSKGTYAVNGDHLTIHLTQATWEYQLLPTKTGLTFVQLSESGLGYGDGAGTVLAWQKGFPIDFDKSDKMPIVEKYDGLPIGKISDSSALNGTSWVYKYSEGSWPFAIHLNADGTYRINLIGEEETHKQGVWTFHDGVLHIDDMQFIEVSREDMPSSFYYEDADGSISIYYGEGLNG